MNRFQFCANHFLVWMCLLMLSSMVGVFALDTYHQVVLLSLECVIRFLCLFCEGVNAQVFSFVFSGRT